MLRMIPPGGEGYIEICTERLGPGSWRSCVYDQDHKVVQVLGSGASAAEAASLGYAFLVQKDLAGWRTCYPDRED